ncbi:MAG: trypsin-like serine peptidase [Panacagrimonas sp.]
MPQHFLVLLVLLGTLATSATAAPLSSRELDRIPLHVLSTAALERARAALGAESARGAIRLAVPAPMNLGVADGAWSEDGDTAIWRARLYSAGASLLIAHLDHFDLPPGAELRFSDSAGRVVHGPYTAAHRGSDGGLWTPLVPGEEGVIEVRVPAAQREQMNLRVATLGHGVYPLSDQGVQPKAGACNFDAVCETDPGWRNQSRSVVLLQNATTACSGSLMNTTAQDLRPYVLTATHCGFSAANASSVVAYFNYQTSTCGGARNGSLGQTLSGAQLLFRNVLSDHTLLRLNSTPPASYNAYYAGFDASASALPQNGRGFHHPSGDEKSVSSYTTPGVKESILLSGATVDSFRISWATGVTEQGSSGSGLWNENMRVVGVLSGGDSSCGTFLRPRTAGPDYYGRLHVAWSAGLQAQLDPSNTGATSLAGRNHNAGTGISPTPTPTPAPPPAPNPSTGGGSSGGGGGGAFGAGLWLLALGLARCLSARRASRV